jgi:hypothetical protein
MKNVIHNDKLFISQNDQNLKNNIQQINKDDK